MSFAISFNGKVVEIEREGSTIFKAEISFMDETLRQRFIGLVDDELKAVMHVKKEPVKREPKNEITPANALETTEDILAHVSKKYEKTRVKLDDQIVQAVIDGNQTADEVATKLGVTKNEVSFKLVRLVRQGRIKKISWGHYGAV